MTREQNIHVLNYTKDPQTGTLEILDETEERGSRIPYSTIEKYKEQYVGKRVGELVEPHYDPAIARWAVHDPIVHFYQSPYSAFDGNPVFWADPSGAAVENLGVDTDFKFDKKTGEITQVGETNDKPDRILKTKGNGDVKYDKNGEAKIAMDGIAKGILKDGMNFKENNNTIAVNGKNADGTAQPTTEQVEDFVVGFANKIVGKEMSGYTLGYDQDNIANVLVEKYKGNTSNSGASLIFEKGSIITSISILNLKDGQYNNGFGIQSHFHTHLDMYGPNDHPSTFEGGDMDHKKATGDVPHYIINSNGKHKY